MAAFMFLKPGPPRALILERQPSTSASLDAARVDDSFRGLDKSDNKMNEEVFRLYRLSDAERRMIEGTRQSCPVTGTGRSAVRPPRTELRAELLEAQTALRTVLAKCPAIRSTPLNAVRVV